jgi:effector-binding domain-containing protein
MRIELRAVRCAAIHATLLMLVVFGAMFAHAQPATQPAKSPLPNDPPNDPPDLPEFVMTELRVQDFPAVTYLYTQQETTIGELGNVIPGMLQKLEEAIDGGEVKVAGAPLFIYEGTTGDMDKPFQLLVGFPVAEGTKPQADLQVKQLEPYHCATIIYSGSMQNVGQAYQKVFTDIFAAGLKPTGGSREMHMYFESLESPNNIFQIQVAVQK